MSKSILLTRFFLTQILRDKKSSSFRKITVILLVYLMVNIFLSAGYVKTFDQESYFFVSLTICLFYVGFVVVLDFQNVFLLGTGSEFLRSLPVEPSKLFMAKFFSSTLFTFLIIIFIIIPQVYFYTSYVTGCGYIFSFAFLNIMFSVTVTGLFLLLIGVILKHGKKINLLIILFQTLFFVFVFLTSLYSRTPPGFDRINIFDNPVFKFSPQYFYITADSLPERFIAVLVIAIGVVFAFYKFASKNFYLIEKNLSDFKTQESNTKSNNYIKIYTGFFSKVLCTNKLQSSMYYLTAKIFGNSREMQIKTIPVFVIPVVFVLIGATANISEFLILGNVSGIPFRSEESPELLSPTLSILLLLSAKSVITNLKFSDSKSGDTSWILSTVTKPDSNIRSGSVKFFVSVYFLPLFIILFFILAYSVPVEAVLLNLIFLFSAVMLYLSLSVRISKFIPFSLDPQKENITGRLGGVFLSIIGGIIIFLVQIFVFQNVIFVVAVSLLFLLAAFYITK